MARRQEGDAYTTSAQIPYSVHGQLGDIKTTFFDVARFEVIVMVLQEIDVHGALIAAMLAVMQEPARYNRFRTMQSQIQVFPGVSDRAARGGTAKGLCVGLAAEEIMITSCTEFWSDSRAHPLK